MSYVSVKTDISGALRKFGMVQDEAKAAIVRALNKTAVTGRKDASDEIKTAGYGLKVSDIKDAISIRRASRSTLEVGIRAKGRPIGLIKYSARETKKGVTIKVKGARKLLRGAFIATMPNGHQGVFLRKPGMVQGKRGRQILVRKLGHELFGPAVPAMFANEIVQRAIVSAIRTRFPVVLDQELNYLRSKGRA